MAGTTQISLAGFSELADTTQRMVAAWPDLIDELSDVRSLYQTMDIPRGTGNQRIVWELEGEMFARYKAEGADSAKTQVIKGYSKTGYIRRFAAEIDITWEAREQGKNQEVITRLTNLSTFAPQRMALDLTHRFTFAASTSYTDMDGESVDVSMGDTYALQYASHTLTGTSTTYSTVVTGNPIFSQGGLEVAMEIANTQTLDNFGNMRTLGYNTVVTSNDPATVREVRQLLNSTADNTQDNPGVTNTYKNMFRHVILPRLATTAAGAYDSTKKKQWHYVAAGQWQAYFCLFEAPNVKTPQTMNNGEDIHSDDWVFGVRASWLIMVVSAKGNLSSLGTGA
jgi:hypothetical protein